MKHILYCLLICLSLSLMACAEIQKPAFEWYPTSLVDKPVFDEYADRRSAFANNGKMLNDPAATGAYANSGKYYGSSSSTKKSSSKKTNSKKATPKKVEVKKPTTKDDCYEQLKQCLDDVNSQVLLDPQVGSEFSPPKQTLTVPKVDVNPPAPNVANTGATKPTNSGNSAAIPQTSNNDNNLNPYREEVNQGSATQGRFNPNSPIYSVPSE